MAVLGALFGAAGVALSALAAHRGGVLAPAAAMLLAHAPVLLLLGLLSQPWPVRMAGWLLAAGTMLFAADLLTRELLGGRLFPFAAPAGGLMMIVGWLALAGAVALRRR